MVLDTAAIVATAITPVKLGIAADMDSPDMRIRALGTAQVITATKKKV